MKDFENGLELLLLLGVVGLLIYVYLQWKKYDPAGAIGDLAKFFMEWLKNWLKNLVPTSGDSLNPQANDDGQNRSKPEIITGISSDDVFESYQPGGTQ